MDILLEFAAKALNMTTEEVKELSEQDGGLEELTSKYTAHIKAQKDAGYKSAERKVNSQWEQGIREKFSIQSDTKGLDLLEEANEVFETKLANVKPTEITEAAIKKHPLYLKMEQERQDVEKNLTAKFETEKAQLQEAFAQKETFAKVKDKAQTIIDSLKPILSEDPQKAAAQKSIILRELENYRYMDNNGELVLLNKETGERLETEQGHPIKFEEVVKNITTSYYDLQKVDQKSSPNRKPEDGTPPTVAKPNNAQEYQKMLADPNLSHEQKQAVQDAWYAAQS